MSPFWRFPFNSLSALLPKAGLDCHLVRTAILSIFQVEQSRSFPQQLDISLASFAA